MAYNQLNDFFDTFDSSIHKHIVMFYEEPEYAKQVQIRFINDGLKKGECSVYAARDDDDLLLTKRDMKDYGVDVEKFSASGHLQFFLSKPYIVDSESYRKGKAAFREATQKQFSNAQNNSSLTLLRIRGVGSIYRDLFFDNEIERNYAMASSQLLVEKLFQLDNTSSFEGLWMCAYHIKDIAAEMEKEWMIELLRNHDVALFLREFSNGLALYLK